MSSSRRWNRTSAAASSDQAQSNTRGQEYHSSGNDATGTHSSDGYALRRSEEIPDDSFRTPSTLPNEDHLAFCYDYRRQTDWFQAHERVRKKRERNLHTLMGPHNMRPTDRHEMFMDAIAWILHWGTSHGEFDESLKWTSSFLKYLCGFTTQAEENWFDERCNDFHVDMTSSSRRSYYMSCSKKLSNVLRHCRDRTLFNASGAMNISLLFDQMQGDNPKEYHMSGADFAAMLLCNPKQRFFVEISMRWQWYPYSPMAEYPFDVRLGAFQGHSNQVVDPTVAHHQLTYDEAMSLGWIFHVTDFMNLDSIQQSGLKTFVKGSGKGRRDAVHFMYHNDNGQGYIRMAEGTKPPRNYRRPVYLVLDPSFIVDNQLYLTKNGVILYHGDIPFQYLHVKEQIPTIACNVVHQGRGHSLPPSVTGGSWHRDTTWKHVMKEKGPTFIPGHDIPEEVRITAWEFMGQQVPQNYGRLVFGTPLCNEKDFDPVVDSIYGAAAEGSQERERRLMKPWKTHMNNHQEEDALQKERNLKMYGSNNAHHQEVQNLHNMMILNKMLKTINKRSHQWKSRTTQWVKKLSTSGKQKIHQMISKTLLWNRLPKVQFLHRIPGSCMRQVLSVQEKRAVNSSRTPQEKK